MYEFIDECERIEWLEEQLRLANLFDYEDFILVPHLEARHCELISRLEERIKELNQSSASTQTEEEEPG